MNALDALRGKEGLADGLGFGSIDEAIHKIVKGAPAELPTHLGNHESNDQRRDGIQNRESGEITDDAEGDNERGSGIGTGMPSVGDQHAGLHFGGDAEHVAEEEFLREKSDARDVKRGHIHIGNGVRVFEFACGGPEHADAHTQQEDTKCEGGGGFETVMSVGMIFVGVLFAVVPSEEHNEVGNKIGEGMNPVGDESLGASENPDDDLNGSEDDVDPNAHPSAPGSGLCECIRMLMGGILSSVEVKRVHD